MKEGYNGGQIDVTHFMTRGRKISPHLTSLQCKSTTDVSLLFLIFILIIWYKIKFHIFYDDTLGCGKGMKKHYIITTNVIKMNEWKLYIRK